MKNTLFWKKDEKEVILLLFQGSPILYQRRAVQPPGSPYRFSACPHLSLATCNLSALAPFFHVTNTDQSKTTLLTNCVTAAKLEQDGWVERGKLLQSTSTPVNTSQTGCLIHNLTSFPDAQCTKPRARSYHLFLSQSSLLLMNSTAATQLRAARHNCGQLRSKMPATVIYLYLEISSVIFWMKVQETESKGGKTLDRGTQVQEVESTQEIFGTYIKEIESNIMKFFRKRNPRGKLFGLSWHCDKFNTAGQNLG